MYEEKKKKNLKQKTSDNRFFTSLKETKEHNLYSEILTTIHWFNLLKKLAILLLSIILIIFTISRINKFNQKKAFSDQNLTLLKDSLYNYYKNQPLPKNTGDSFSLTLEQMQKLEIVSEFKDCDSLNSYTILTKTKTNEFLLKIHLICPNSQNTLEEKIIFNL